MIRVFLSLGSNIEPEINIDAALSNLGKIVKLERVSTVYKTEPVGDYSGCFYNCVVKCKTNLSLKSLKEKTTNIEKEMGRLNGKNRKQQDRAIDIDVLIYGDMIDAGIPHQDIFNRPFVAAGLCELAPDWKVFPTYETPCEIAAKLGKAGMVPLEDYTSTLIRKHYLSS